MHRTSPHPPSGSRPPRPLPAFALALALVLAVGQLSPMVPPALALGLREPVPPAEPPGLRR